MIPAWYVRSASIPSITGVPTYFGNHEVSFTVANQQDIGFILGKGLFVKKKKNKHKQQQQQLWRTGAMQHATQLLDREGYWTNMYKIYDWMICCLGGQTKKKIQIVSGANIEVNSETSLVKITGTELNIIRCQEYIDLVLAQGKVSHWKRTIREITSTNREQF